MKTIAFNRNRGSLFSSLLFLGGVVALYLYRDRISALIPVLRKAIGNVAQSVDTTGVSQHLGVGSDVPTTSHDLGSAPLS